MVYPTIAIIIRNSRCNPRITFTVILELLSEGVPVDLLYFDFSKAFDTVPHYRLLAKLERYGITGNTLEIIQNFLCDRTMKVVVGGKMSNTKLVTSGVPQGSVLGPLLFVLFINDLPEGVKNSLKLFADDVKLIANASSLHDIAHDIKVLEDWENLWLLRFNPSKCKVLHIDKNDNPDNKYAIGGVELKSVSFEKDLGVVTNCDLSWDTNMKSSVSKANSVIAWVARSVITRSPDVMLLIYKSLIRPHIEYCVQVWNPVARHGNWAIILELENVQRRFTRLIDGIGLLPYSERLKKLKLTTLAERRMRADMIETYKIVSKSVNYGSNLIRLSRSGTNIVSKAAITDKTRRESFPERIISFWNVLPVYVKASKTVEHFKINLEKYKRECFEVGNNYWDVSNDVLNKIEGGVSADNRSRYVQYMKNNPWTARSIGVNTWTPKRYG